MMYSFADERQRNDVCRTLADQVRPGLWGDDTGPSQGAKHLDPGVLSPGERVLWDLAWAVWNSAAVAGPSVTDLARLDETRLILVAGLLAAIAMDGPTVGSWNRSNVDHWLKLHAPAEEVRP